MSHKGPEVDQPSPHSHAPAITSCGASSIHYYASTNSIVKIREAARPRLLLPDFYRNSPLHYAAESGSYAVAQFIVDIFPETEFYNLEHVTPGHVAARVGDAKMLEILSHSQKILTSPTFSGWTPLHFAVFHRRFECVKFLVESNTNSVNDLIFDFQNEDASIQKTCLRFSSCLDLAKYVGDDQLAEFLRSKGALSGLHAAALSNNMPAISFFATSKISPYAGKINGPEGQQALKYAACRGNYQICHFLMEMGVVPDNSGKDGVLTLAVLSYSIETVTVVAKRSSEQEVARACFLAADLSKQDIVMALLDCKVALGEVENGDSLLIRFVRRGLRKAAERILNDVPNPKHKDSKGRSALHYAAALGAVDMTKALTRKVDVNDRDNYGRNALHYACYAYKIDLVRILTITKSDFSLVDFCGFTPFGASLVLGQELKAITDIDPKIRYSLDFQKLLDSLQPEMEEIEVYDFLEDKTRSIIAPSILMVDGTMLTFIQKKLSGKPEDLTDLPLLHYCIVMGGSEKLIQSCLAAHPEMLNALDGCKRTPLQLALFVHRKNIAATCLKHSPDITSLDADGNSIFHYLCDDAYVEFVEQVYGFEPYGVGRANHRGESPIHLACANGASRVLNELLVRCEERRLVSAADVNGKTPLKHAIENGHAECMKLLFSFGVENELVTSIQHGNVDRALELLDEGYPVDHVDKNGVSPLHAAAQLPSVELVKLLISKKANISRPTGAGLRAISCAALANSIPVVLELVHAGVNLTGLQYKDQPFHLATDPACKKFLLDFWKREHYMKELVSYLQYRGFMITARIELVKAAKGCSPKGAKPQKPLKVFDELIEFLEHMRFITDHIVQRTRTASSYQSHLSVHHYLQILETLDAKTYPETLLEEFSQLCHLSASFDTEMVFHFLLPCQWVVSCKKLLEKLEAHLCPQIDDISAYDKMLNTIRKLSDVMADVLQKANAMILDKMKDVFALPKNRPDLGSLILYTSGKIENVRTDPRIEFNGKTFLVMKEFFGSECFLPRVITKRKTTQANVALFENFLCIRPAEDERFVLLPLSLVEITPITGNEYSTYHVLSPLGAFCLQLTAKSTFTTVLCDVFQSRINEIHSYDWGEHEMQTSKDKTFLCLVTYGQRRTMKIRHMLVKAGRACECMDVCRTQVTDTVSDETVAFRVLVKELRELSIPVIRA